MINTLPQSLIDSATEMLETHLQEAAVPEAMKERIFYHGTTNREAALGIAKEGIKAPDYKGKKGDLVPVQGKVYVTPHIHYAQIYALGGDIAGSQSTHYLSDKEKYGDHGYVFAVKGHQLQDIQPDEDSIGEMIGKKSPAWLYHKAQWKLNPNTLKKVADGEYSKYASAGKQLVKHMSDTEKQDLIERGAHIAHHGSLVPDQVFRIHRDKIPLLKRDGSNFFDHAEQIDMKDI